MAEIKDSGDRTQFKSGAVRDMHEGKGRCDLMPLDIVADALNYYCGHYETIKEKSDPLEAVYRFQETHDPNELYHACAAFALHNSEDFPALLLEVGKHFEDGAKKYGERNWEKGIPAHCYIDSAVRHYLKWYMDLYDERHDRAFAWNLLCLAWTLKHRPECDDLRCDAHGNG